MTLPYRLVVLGAPTLRGPDGEVCRFRTRKHLGLLVYLSMYQGEPQRRDGLATLLWPNAPMDEARHSLATALSVIRGRLGRDSLESSRETIHLVPGRVLTDIAALEAQALDDPDLAPIGRFCDALEIPTAPDFERWRDTIRARLLPALCACFVRRIENCRRTGDTKRMETLAHQLQHLDPLAEQGARAVMEARALAGDRVGALREYGRWRVDLAEELGASPSAELVRLADRLRRGGENGHPRQALASVPTEHWKERVFIGRSAEYATCYALWGEARAGAGRNLLLRGEGGSGKTILAERLVTAVALEGAGAVRVTCHELERELPFGVIAELVAQLLDLPGASATPPEYLSELSQLVVKVRHRWPSVPPTLPLIGEAARIRFSEATLALIASLSEEQPLAIVVDDIHRADSTSLAVLHLLARRIVGLPVMLLLTSGTRTDDEPPMARRFAENAKLLGLQEVVLGPLTPQASEEMLGVLLGSDAAATHTVRRAIIAGASGNPMVLELLVADWRRRGDASLALTLGAMTPGPSGPPPEALKQAIDDTLSALDTDARAVVELGAILGKRLNDLSMYTLVDLPVARTMRAMTTLAAQRILRDAGSHLEFASEYVRGHAYMGMTTPLRRNLHALVADRLLSLHASDEPIPGLEVAWHLVRGGRLVDAVPYLLAGGRGSIRAGAADEADLALATGIPALSGEARRLAILLHVESLQELGRWGDSLRVLDTPCDEYTASEEQHRRVLHAVGRRWAGALAQEDLVPTTHQLIDICKSATDPEVRAKAIAAIPYLQTQTRDPTTLREFGRVLEGSFVDDLDDYQQLHWHFARAWWSNQHGRVQEVRRCINAAQSLAEAGAYASSLVARLAVGTGMVCFHTGDYHGAIEPLNAAARLARRIDNQVHLSCAAAALSIAYGRTGDHVQQMDWARQALECLRQDEWGVVALSASYELAMAATHLGRDSEATSVLAANDQRFTRGQPEWIRQAWLLMKADVLALTGAKRRAEMMAAKAMSVDGKRPLVHDFIGLFARWKALLARSPEERCEATMILRDLLTMSGTVHAKDHAEVLASICYLAKGDLAFDEGAREEATLRLRNLPPAVSGTLLKLGILEEDGETSGRWGVK